VGVLTHWDQMVDYHRNALIRRYWIRRTGFGIFLSGATSCNLGPKVVEDSLDGLEIRLLSVWGMRRKICSWTSVRSRAVWATIVTKGDI
jgi:hypothetical protein